MIGTYDGFAGRPPNAPNEPRRPSRTIELRMPGAGDEETASRVDPKGQADPRTSATPWILAGFAGLWILNRGSRKRRRRK